MMVRMQITESEITGSLQAKIMMILRDEQLCGLDIMKRLKIKSPGTIYPVLEALKKKGLIGYRVETAGAVRKKIYFLTNAGREQIRKHLIRSARFCCDIASHIGTILDGAKGLVEVKRHQKLLSTLQYDEMTKYFRGADLTFSSDLDLPSESYDVAVSFVGVGCLIGKENADIINYMKALYHTLKSGGSLLAIEAEKTDNFFARMLFQDIFALKEQPGLDKEALSIVLERVGFRKISVFSKNGLLYAVAQKPLGASLSPVL